MSADSDLLQLLGPRPWVVGHRGAAGSELENTLASIDSALAQEAAMIELDVQLTADEAIVVFHDWDLRRVAGRGEIVERTELERLQAVGLSTTNDDKAYSIPTLEAALGSIPPDQPVNLEIKRRFHDARTVIERLEPHLASQRPVLVSSFDWNLLAEARRNWPDQPLAPLARYRAEALLAAGEEIGAFSVHAHRELAPELLGSNQISGRPLLAYTVNDPVEARSLVARGAAGFFTDEPGRMRAVLASDD